MRAPALRARATASRVLATVPETEMPIVEWIAREDLVEMGRSVAAGLHGRHRLGRDARHLLEGELGRQPGHVRVPAAGDDDPLHGE